MTAIVLSAALMASVVGCASPSQKPSAGISAPISASPSAIPAPVEPPALIPGDCGDFIGSDDLAAFGDPQAVKGGADGIGATLAVNRQAGDLRCSWESGGLPYWLSVVVQRDAQLRIDDPTGPGFTEQLDLGTPAGVGADRSAMTCSVNPIPQVRCDLTVVVGDYLLSASWVSPRTDLTIQAARDLMSTVFSRSVDRLQGEPVEAAWVAPAGAWPTPADCAGIESAGAVASALASPGLVVEVTTGVGEDGSVSPEVGGLGGLTECGWGHRGERPADQVQALYARVVSGGGWSFPTVAAADGFLAVTIDGADEAGTVCTDYPAQLPECELTARVGENIVAVREFYCCGPNDITREQLIAGGTAVVAGLVELY